MNDGTPQIDLTAIIVQEPVITEARAVDGATGVVLSGRTGIDLNSAQFRITFVPFEGKWAIAELNVLPQNANILASVTLPPSQAVAER